MDTAPIASRTIYHEDAIGWLARSGTISGASIVTSLPDRSEFPSWDLAKWKAWFTETVVLILSRLPPEGVAIFFQTDVKHEGVWVNKGFLCQKGAEEAGHALLWHKIVCRLPAGRTTYGRPGYSHLLCFSKGVRADPSLSTTDVLPQLGQMTWARGMGTEACRVACQFILSHTTTRTVVAPFCGHGTVLAVANSLGLSAIGVEHSAKRAKRAKELQLPSPGLI